MVIAALVLGSFSSQVEELRRRPKKSAKYGAGVCYQANTPATLY